MRYTFTILTLLGLTFFTGCSSKKIKDKSFLTAAVVDSAVLPKLNIFEPTNKSVSAPV